MLAIDIQIWPGGDHQRRFSISGVAAANISGLADVSDYYAIIVEDGHVTGTAHIEGHPRQDGAVALLRRILTAPPRTDAIPDEWVDRLADRFLAGLQPHQP